jgi:hypothetical protein
MICQIPRLKSINSIFNEQFINYIAIIIVTPFENQIDPDTFKTLVLKNKAIYTNVTAPPSSPSGGNKKSLKEYITILGRKRLIYKKGRSKFIKYHGDLIKLKDAKILDKKTKKL